MYLSMNIMNITLIYLISLASTFAALLLWRIYRLLDLHTRRTIFLFVRKKLLYTLVYRRRASSDNVNLVSLVNICLLVAGNMTACAIKITDRSELAKRCGRLFVVNIIPLLLGGRGSILMNHFLRAHPSEQSLLHRWMGRICVAQGLIHGIVYAMSTRPNVPQILMISILSALGILSTLYVRRYMYEIFQKSHLVFTLALIGLLWFHIPVRLRQSIICLAVASGIWVFQECYWITRLAYRNAGWHSSNTRHVTMYSSSNGSPEAVDVSLTLKKPWTVRPNQYLYLTLPRMSRHHAGFLQTHPYMIAWVDGSEVSILVQRHKGFSNDIFTVPNLGSSSFIVDGPYGYTEALDSYDKVLFVASGIGIAAHLLTIKALLEAHEDQSARVRRITLIWFLESTNQEEWASSYLQRLLAMDHRHIFTLAIYVPSQTKLLKLENFKSDRCRRTDQALDLHWYIHQEGSSEAGNMAVSVCGTPHFEEAVRQGVRSSEQDITLSFTGFHPEETAASQASRVRYSAS